MVCQENQERWLAKPVYHNRRYLLAQTRSVLHEMFSNINAGGAGTERRTWTGGRNYPSHAGDYFGEWSESYSTTDSTFCVYVCVRAQKGDKGEHGRLGIAGMPGLPGTPVSVIPSVPLFDQLCSSCRSLTLIDLLPMLHRVDRALMGREARQDRT